MYLKGKKGVIMGIANDHSIAWGIAKKLSEEGAELCFMYAGETLLRRVKPLAESLDSNFLIECNVLDSDSIKAAFEKGKYLDTSRDNFTQTMLISCFSFTETAKEASKLMTNGGSMVTLSYDGSQRVVPNYNVMGVAKAALESSVRYLAADLGSQNIRVNSLSAGPMKTLAMAGISGGKDMLKWSDKNSLMQRNISLDDVGKSGLYLLSDLSSGVTGENHYVDCGYNKVGVPREI